MNLRNRAGLGGFLLLISLSVLDICEDLFLKIVYLAFCLTCFYFIVYEDKEKNNGEDEN